MVVGDLEEDEGINLSVTVESLNLMLPSLGTIRARASSPNGMQRVTIVYMKYSSVLSAGGSPEILAGGGCGTMVPDPGRTTWTYPWSNRTAGDADITGGTCFYAIFALDEGYHHRILTDRISMGTDVLVPETPLAIPCLILAVALCRGMWKKRVEGRV